MTFTIKEVITILRHCGNQGDACPCSDCLLKDNPKGNECLEMYNIAADKIEKLNQENENLKRLLRLAVKEVHRPNPNCKYRFEYELEKSKIEEA